MPVNVLLLKGDRTDEINKTCQLSGRCSTDPEGFHSSLAGRVVKVEGLV